MKSAKRYPSRHRGELEHAVPLIEKMSAAREISSCCVGVEALLETDNEIDADVKRRQRSAADEGQESGANG